MNQPYRPLLVAVVTGLAVIAACAALAAPLVWIKQLRESVANNTVLRETSARTSRLEPNGAKLGPIGDPLIDGESVGRASAVLQLKLDELAATEGVAIRSFQVSPPRRDGDVTHIVVTVTLQATTVAFRKFLYTLETSFPLLVVDELSVRPLPAAIKDTSAAMPLEITLAVHGLAVPGKGL